MPLSTPARMPIPDSTLTPMAVTHRFVPGLRFEDVLSYQTCTEAGQAAWDALPLDPETPEDFTDDGAWWCARRCAAVLLRRPWREMRLRPHLPAWSPAWSPARPPVRPPLQPEMQLPMQPPLASGAGEVAHTLWSLLPGWDVVCHADTGRDPVAACAPALRGGGSALLLMQSEEMDSRSPRKFWAWVVGLEAQSRMAGDPALAGEAQEEVRALLTVPFGWPASWSCGYAAKVHRNREGLCDVGGISGRWHISRCRAIITLAGRPGA